MLPVVGNTNYNNNSNTNKGEKLKYAPVCAEIQVCYTTELRGKYTTAILYLPFYALTWLSLLLSLANSLQYTDNVL